jgi:tetratricopeptide (TPR) repeat protein
MKKPVKKSPAIGSSETQGPVPGRKLVLIMLLLAVLAFLPYGQTIGHDFIDYDDGVFVTDNPEVRAGLSWEGMLWAITAFHAGNWMPLTWMSHMLDVSLFGMEPGRHHLVNVLIHALSTALLFLALFRMTGAVWPGAFVAALFGIHPLHVESVAWVAERKDVLSGLFFMLVLLSYERYVRRRGAGPYLLVALCLALGLLSKSMLVTVPFVLLLLDVWPLGRTSFALPADGIAGRPVPWAKLLLEKLPFLFMAAAVSVITVAAQREGGAMNLMERELLPFGVRLANALVSYAAYLEKTVWPRSLAFIYPHQGSNLSGWKIALSAGVLATVTLVVIRQFRRPYLAVGWFWYAGMLVPVIGLVQVGKQAMADRYTYLPLIGIFIMIAWAGKDIISSASALRKKIIAGTAGVVVLVFLIAAIAQVSYWRDYPTLLRHATTAVSDNWPAHRMLGNVLSESGSPEEAIVHYRESLRIQPWNSYGHNNLAVELARQGNYPEAIEHYREAIRIRPAYAEAYNNLGNALAVTGRRDEAIEQYREALRLRPGWAVVRNNLRSLLAEQEKISRGRRK